MDTQQLAHSAFRCFFRTLVAFLILEIFSSFSPVEAATLRLKWDPVTATNLQNYFLYTSTQSGTYTTGIPTGNTTQLTLSNVVSNITNYFTVTYVTSDSVESVRSAELAYFVPAAAVIPIPVTEKFPNYGTVSTDSGTTLPTSETSGPSSVGLVSKIPDATIFEDSFYTYSLSLSYAGAAASNMIVIAKSGNITMTPSSRIAVTGTGSTRLITVAPVSNTYGKSWLDVYVIDGKTTNTLGFYLNVVSVNDLPLATGLPSTIGLVPGGKSPTYSIGVSDVETSTSSLRVWAISDNETVLPSANLLLAGSGATRTLSLQAPAQSVGNSVVRLAVADNVSTNWFSAQVSINSSGIFTPAPVEPPPVALPSKLPDATIAEDSTFTYTLSLAYAGTSAGSLTVSATSGNTAMTPNSRIAVTGTGSNRVITITPLPNTYGRSYVDVSVTDGTTTNASGFNLTVVAANDIPQATGLPATITLIAGTTSPTYSIGVSDIETSANALRVWAVSDNEILLPSANLAIAGSDVSRTLTLQAPLQSAGSTPIRLAVADDAATNWYSSQITINATTLVTSTSPVVSTLEGPSKIPDATILEDSTFNYSMSLAYAGAAANTLTVIATSGNLTMTPSNRITVTGTGSSRLITITPTPNTFGRSYISVDVTDGKTTNTLGFNLNVTPVNDLPQASGLPASIALLPGAKSPTYSIAVSDVETSASTLRVWAVSDNESILPSSNLTVGGSGATRTLSLQAPSGSLGITGIRLAVADDVTTNWFSSEVVVSPPNTPPQLSINSDALAVVGTPFLATATVSDDGIPLRPGATTTTWSLLSGPAAVPTSAPTPGSLNALFSVPGSYVFRCTADDGQARTAQDLLVNVTIQSLSTRFSSEETSGPEITRVNVAEISDTAIRLAFHTREPSRGAFEYRLTSSEIWSSLEESGELSYEHTLTVVGLRPDADYSIRALSLNAEGLSSTSAPVLIKTLREVKCYESLPLERAFLSSYMTTEPTIGGRTILRSQAAGAAEATLQFEVAQMGTYTLWARVLANSSPTAVFGISVDETVAGVFEPTQNAEGNDWAWSRSLAEAPDGGAIPFTVSLSRGTHTLHLFGLEDGVALSHLLLTSDASYQPDDVNPVVGTVPLQRLAGPVFAATLRPGWSLTANPLQRAPSTLPLALLNPPEGTVIHAFASSTASEGTMLFGEEGWTDQPTLEWMQVASVYNPSDEPIQMAFAGTPMSFYRLPELIEGEQMLVMPFPAGGTLESLLGLTFLAGDAFTYFDSATASNVTCSFDGSSWDRIPTLSVGEAAILSLVPRER